MKAFIASLIFVVLAEMGDKTQLATVALAVKYNSIVNVWLGTTAGMLIADAIGIGIGIVMGKHIPERAIKWFSALVFIAFGVYGLYENLPKDVWSPAVITVGAVFLLTSIHLIARMNAKKT